MANWCLIESDPGVFTELIANFGVQGLQVEELISLDESCMGPLKPIRGLVFLFKCSKSAESQGTPVQHDAPNLYFAQQVISNACATQAILNILMNCGEDVDLGPELTQFKEFTRDLPPDARGLAMSNSEMLRSVHNSFARQESFSMESRQATEDDDLFHFISYVPVGGRIIELDGLNATPIDHGPCDEKDWTAAAVPVIQARMQAYEGGEIRFNLMAVVQDRRQVIAEEREQLEEQLAAAISTGQGDSPQAKLLQAEIQQKEAEIEAEEEKRRRYRRENMRRKHNYIPMFLELLRCLAEKQKLAPLVAVAKTKAEEQAAKRAKK